MLGAGGASVAVDRMQAKNSLSTIFPTPKPPATVPKTPKPWSVNYAMKWLKEQIPEVRIVQDSMGGSYPVFMKRSGGEKTSSELGNYSERTFKERKIDVGKSDIDNLRKKWNVPETETVAVGKTDVRGLEDLKFEAGSPKVRKEAGLPDLDEAMPNRNIKAPGNNPLFTRHAEEGILNEFDSAVIKSGINPEDVVGTLKLHQSNPSGVCRKCYQGLANEKVPPGVLKQLSIKYPNLILEVTSEVDESIKVTGRLNLKIKNGNYID